MTLSTSTVKLVILTAAILVGCVVRSDARPALRHHTAIHVASVTVAPAAYPVHGVRVRPAGFARLFTSNRLRALAAGEFPTDANANRIAVEFRQGTTRAGECWYALRGAVALGFDACFGHARPTGPITPAAFRSV